MDTRTSDDDAHLLFDAAQASADIYDKPNTFSYLRTVEQYAWLSGALIAGVKFDQNGKRAFVSIRGTSPIGNWLFTNLQAHFTRFNVVDETLSASPAYKYQGGRYRTPVTGALHQGFFRAFSWLWYGTEPILGAVERSRLIGKARLWRYLIIFAFLPFLFGLIAGSWLLGACLGLAISFLFVSFESGIWEDIFRIEPEPSGDEPLENMNVLNQCDLVVFTGHSLGGAIASIAFAVYRTWCKSDVARKDNAVLLTFGAPRVGDVPFMDDFAAAHAGRFCHVVHPGDPVPELPPNGLFELWHRRIWRRGLIGFAVLLFFPFWAAIGKLAKANRAARWTANGLILVPGQRDTLKFSNHSMAGYLQWAQKAEISVTKGVITFKREVTP